MARSITFLVDGPVDTQIIITEQVDGTLRFDLEVLGTGLIGDLRGLFFDLKDLNSSSAGLSVVGVDGSEDIVRSSYFAEEAVSRVQGDVNIKGRITKDLGLFDGGIEFGTEGIGKDDVSSVSFVLSSDLALSLDSLDLADLALRYTSVGSGEDRDASAKIAGMTSGVARNDAYEVDENTQNTADLLANDTNGTQSDGTRKTVISVQDTLGFLSPIVGGFERTVVIDGLELGTLTISKDGFSTFVADGPDVDKLGHDAIKTYGFTYETQSNTGNLTTADVVLTIDGQNDQPVAIDLFGDVGEDDAGVTVAFVASDIDIGDTLSYQILTDPTDAFGHQYGEVTNNNDGTFTFNPLGDFQFLEEGESRDVTFQYEAIDDSGVGISPIAPEETDTSDAKTVTITVNGSYDAPIVINEEVLFESSNQSMWGTGDALQINWREFYGPSWNKSFNQTIVNSGSLQIVPAIKDPTGVTDIVIYDGYSVTSPSVSVGGHTEGRFGISPYFELDAGSVDSHIPVDIDLTYEVQYESGDHISILTGYAVDNAAFFNTASPSITFGIDLVFEFMASGNLTIGSSTFGGGGSYALFPTINIDIDEPGLPGADVNLLEFSSDTGIYSDIFETTSDWLTQDGAGGYIIGHPDYDTNLALSFPSIDTTGVLTGPSRLESAGSDDFAVLDLDLDEIVSEVSKYVPPMHYNGSEGLVFNVDLPGFVNDLGWKDINVDLFSVNWDFELIDIDLISTLTAVQDFTLDIKELPLMVELENGDKITGFSMGETIEFDLPDWDVDLYGDKDGIMDYTLSIDMDAMLNNWTTLDFSLDILARALKAQFGYTSDVVGDYSFSLFGDANEGFLVAQNYELLNVSPLAELFGDKDPEVSGFDLVGFNTVTYENGFSIA